MSSNSASVPTATADASRFVTEKVSEEGGVTSSSTGGSPASKHSSTGGGGGGGGGGTPQATHKGGVPDGNCSPVAVPQKGKGREKSALKRVINIRFRGGEVIVTAISIPWSGLIRSGSAESK
jgi:hypothetical protein